MSKFQAKSLIVKSKLEEGIPGPEHFDVIESTINEHDLHEKGIIVKLSVLSADPFLRTTMKSDGHVNVGEVLRGLVAGEVIASKNPNWQVGDMFGANLPLSTVQILTEKCLSEAIMWKLTGLVDQSNISWGVHVLGMTGATAYLGLLGVLKPKEGETIFISDACGAVGGLVGMMAKSLFNCKVIGSCGGDRKCQLIKEKFGFDASIDYKCCTSSVEEFKQKLLGVCPGGIDMYFDNVGGVQLEAALCVLKQKGRVALCGQISDCCKKESHKIMIDPAQMLYKEQRIEGFLNWSCLKGEQGNFLTDMPQWLSEGKVQQHETPFEGIEQWPLAFQSLFTGNCVGKVVVKV